MRIAQVAPLFESVPPKLYGGTERVVFNLTEGLVARGHDVTLFATGDSETSARLVPIGSEGLRIKGVRETNAPHILLFERVRALAKAFDIIHFHNEYLHFGLARSLGMPTLTTLHGRLDLPEYQDLFSEFRELPLVSISDRQREPLPFQNWLGTVHHGLPEEILPFSPESGRYLAFLGRVSPEKGLEKAIEIARGTNLPLKIAAKVEETEHLYYRKIESLLDRADVEFVGEIGDREKGEFLGGALAVLFPITWPEPFGLVMIESLACGTPVIAFDNGSVPEVIRDGETGFIVENVSEAIEAVKNVSRLDRRHCRADFEKRFVRQRMVRDYLNLYEAILEAWDPCPAVLSRPSSFARGGMN